MKAKKESVEKPADAEPPIPPRSEVVKRILSKCIAKIDEDIDSLAPKDRILLWKDFGDYFDGNSGSKSDIPGMDIRQVTVQIVKGEG